MMIEKLDGASLDISAENRARLKLLFPTVFTETKNDKGELVESIDFERLKAELGKFSDVFETRKERYGMDWPGKKEALKLIQTQSYATLKPCRNESVNFDTTENLFIEGDNLEVLKLLQKSYYGKIKMMYFDPPYNTGKEFIYPDNYSESLETYLEYAGLIDGDGKKFSTNTANEGRFHTKWLNMMYPRLYLARNLLRDDGVIFISIDDNEVSNLRKLCDEIFGEENFVAQVIWERAYSPVNNKKHFSENHDFVLCFAKNINELTCKGLRRTGDANERYRNLDNDIRGCWKPADLSVGPVVEEKVYEIETPSGRKVKPPNGRCWLYSKDRFLEMIADNRIWFGADGNNVPAVKKFLTEVKDSITPMTIWEYTEVGHSQEAAQKLKVLFDGKDYFEYPKSVALISRMIELYCENSDTILDIFAGSATTAHAVLDLNKQDGGNRKFILVQLPEPCSKDSEAFKAGYKTIADIGKERIRRVIKKLTTDNADETQIKKGEKIQSSLFSSENLRESVQSADKCDLGFKVLKLDKSNFKQWQKLEPTTTPEQIVEQLELHIDHISHKATPEDLLFEILIKAGFAITEKIEEKTIAGIKVYSVPKFALLICLENTVTKDLIDTVAELEPTQFICLDSAFQGNDQLKANAVQTFAARNMQKEKHNQIIFKTV